MRVDMNVFRNLPKLLVELRKYRGISSQAALAERMGKSEPLRYAKNKLQKYESGKVHPPIHELDAILSALEISGPMLFAAMDALDRDVPFSLAFAELELSQEEPRTDLAGLEERVRALEVMLKRARES